MLTHWTYTFQFCALCLRLLHAMCLRYFKHMVCHYEMGKEITMHVAFWTSSFLRRAKRMLNIAQASHKEVTDRVPTRNRIFFGTEGQKSIKSPIWEVKIWNKLLLPRHFRYSRGYEFDFQIFLELTVVFQDCFKIEKCYIQSVISWILELK